MIVNVLRKRTEAGIDQDKHEQQRDRYGNQQSSRSLLSVFELPAPGDEISGRNLDLAATSVCASLTKPPMSRPVTLHFTTMRRSAFSRLTTESPLESRNVANCPRGTLSTNGRGDQNIVKLLNLVAIVLLQADEYRKAPLAFKHVRRLVSADGNLGDFKHVGDVESVARQLVAIQRDLQMLLTCDLLDRQVFRSANIRHRIANAVGHFDATCPGLRQKP